MYDRTVPSPFDKLVNTLDHFEFAQSYALYATQAVKPFIDVPWPLPPESAYNASKVITHSLPAPPKIQLGRLASASRPPSFMAGLSPQ